MATDSPVQALEPEESEGRRRDGEGAEMTLLEHLLELRRRVFWMALALVVCMAIFFIPAIGFRFIELLLEPARQSDPDFRPQYIEPMENIFVYFRTALLGGITLAMPVIVYQALRFITPALTAQERKWIFPLIFGGTFAFVAGLAFAYFLVLPLALNFLLNFGSEFAEADWRIGHYINFVTRIMLVLGVVFQTPIVVMMLAKFRVVTAKKMLSWWRYAIILAFTIAAIATPTIDPITQSLVGGPIVVLYFVGIGLAWLVTRNE